MLDALPRLVFVRSPSQYFRNWTELDIFDWPHSTTILLKTDQHQPTEGQASSYNIFGRAPTFPTDSNHIEAIANICVSGILTLIIVRILTPQSSLSNLPAAHLARKSTR